ncbi:hypothetical protein L1987_79505 [Smallanthus sonchifolius]|uniref:Uncharacterized protein n=1 Tax=Smallanthus sonchifolius TaxID=185202 RepID=A0ACB8ZEN4_9ASTR|nr:hypothetical protein L1987_79505 [Smallanthus sonchifolius]
MGLTIFLLLILALLAPISTLSSDVQDPKLVVQHVHRNMQVTIAFNHFGEGLVQRMPRHGYFHVVNNDYTHWEMYAIGGSASPTINSQGNRFLAPDSHESKEVTKREEASEDEWKRWNWRSEGDLMLNGAYFTPSGAGKSKNYARASSLSARSSSIVCSITANAGVLKCKKGFRC